jgi:hypothetical protein
MGFWTYIYIISKEKNKQRKAGGGSTGQVQNAPATHSRMEQYIDIPSLQREKLAQA